MPDVSTLNVMLHGTRIATLTNVGGDRTIFAFTEDYIRNRQRPVLGLRFKDALGELITEFAPTQTSLIPWFSNLLPEGPLRKYLAERARVNQKREFFLLWALGKDLPGAVTIEPAEGEAWPPSAHDGHDEPFENASANALRFSLAGVQLKFSALEDARGGLAIPARGMGGDWIVKLPSREHDGVPENEFSMMTLARKVGIDVPAIQLVDLNAIANLPEATTPSPETRLLVVEALSEVSRVLDGLHPRVREIFLLSQFDGLTYATIAKAQGVSVSFVQKSMSKAFMHCYQAVYAE